MQAEMKEKEHKDI